MSEHRAVNGITDEQIDDLRRQLEVQMSFYITPPVDGAHDPLNQLPPNVGVKIQLTIGGREQEVRVSMQGENGAWRNVRGHYAPDTLLGQWGWVLTPEKADELRAYMNERLAPEPKRVVSGEPILLHEGDSPTPS